MKLLKRTALGLIGAVAMCGNPCQAGEDAKPGDEGGPPRRYQNLVTDEAALEAWSSIGPRQAEVVIEGTALNEVAWNTARTFQNQFDLILPPAEPDLSTMAVQMRLKDVRAIEMFNAMNLYFEAQKLPARWKLTLNGNRPTAILGMEKPQAAATPLAGAEKTGDTVFPIPDILCASGADLDKQSAYDLEDTIAAALDDLRKPGHAKANAPGGPVIKVHAQAGILVFNGTWEETELVRSTLQALKDTAQERKATALDRDLRAKDEAARQDLCKP
ncbi:MAG: hypothetical protein ABSA47_04935 [Verrucomicrobiota bacterium]|jgi:hypothetical protein